MYTVTFVLYEKEGISRADALRYWREKHGPLVKEVPGVRRYVQQHAVAATDQGDPPFLGVATLAFDDEQAFATAAGSPGFEAAVADVANFASTEMAAAIVDEVTIV